MGALQRVERKLEGLVGNTFARLFKGKVHPTEIGRALLREADEQRVVVGEGRVLIPNRYLVTLGTSDYEHLSEWQQELTRTLGSMVIEHAQEEGWSTFGKVLVSLSCDAKLRTGVFEVRSEVDPHADKPRPEVNLTKAPGEQTSQPANGVPVERIVRSTYPPPPSPPVVIAAPPGEPVVVQSHVLVVDGPNTRYPLHDGHNVVGRGQEAQVRLPDTGVSRRHVDVTVVGPIATAHDLGSTNGTIINGQRIAQHPLNDGDVIRIGHSVLVYRSAVQ